jgi:hypothetical protein
LEAREVSTDRLQLHAIARQALHSAASSDWLQPAVAGRERCTSAPMRSTLDTVPSNSRCSSAYECRGRPPLFERLHLLRRAVVRLGQLTHAQLEAHVGSERKGVRHDKQTSGHGAASRLNPVDESRRQWRAVERRDIGVERFGCAALSW